jgi:Fe-S-cluster containining protein
MNSDLAQSWLTFVSQPAVAAHLESIYGEAAAAIQARKPRCDASGRCCHFEAFGHRLYVTGLEAAYTLSRLPATSSPAGVPPVSTTPQSVSPPVLNLPLLHSARQSGACPFLRGTLCTVHAIKPLACRTYYCDPTAQEWQHDLTERLLARIRALHERHAIEYRYGEWRAMLELFTRS